MVNFFRTVYSILIIIIFLICFFLSNIEYACKHDYNNIILFISGLFLNLVLFGFSKVLSNYLNKHKLNRIMLYGVSVILLFVQVNAVYDYYFYTNWDVKAVLTISEHIARKPGEYYYDYLSMYPNNSLLVWIFSLFYRLVYTFNGEEQEAYKLILFFQCLLNSLTGFFLVLLIKKMFNDNFYCIYGYMLYFILLACSPWVSIPYPDSMGLLFPTLILYIINNYFVKQDYRQDMELKKWFLVCSLIYFGYCIKPQIILCGISVVLLEWCCLSVDAIKKNIKYYLMSLLCISFSFLYSVLFINNVTRDLYEPNKSLGITHFLMMGMNLKSGGTYSLEDVLFSNSFNTNDERRAANIDVVRKRVIEMGTTGIMKHLYRKTLTVFNDGTFCWGGEGSFYDNIRKANEKNQLVSIFREVYYNGTTKGKYYNDWSNFEQAIWLSVLLLCCFSSCKKTNKTVLSAMLTLTELIVFLLLFEARARYLYIFVPYFILLDIQGIRNLIKI